MPEESEWTGARSGTRIMRSTSTPCIVRCMRTSSRADWSPSCRTAVAASLDWGCGEAEEAGTIASSCETLFLFDSAPRVRDRLRARYDGCADIVVVNDDALSAIPEGSLDCIAIVSVVQYLGRDVFADILVRLLAKLSIGGRLVIADVIPPDLSPADDVRALLALAWRAGFLGAAIAGLVRTFFSNYRRLRATLGLTRWSEADMGALLAAHGFEARRAAANIGHNQARMTFVATRV